MGAEREIDDVRQFLGYGAINIYGGSYGTRAALVYLRRHAGHVRSVVRDGVAPPDMRLPLYMPRDGQRALDLLISVDTSTAHLAGALGRPVWVLIASAPDWRWMTGREDSPWYPSMRLFRQEAPGEWSPVIERLRGELCALAAGGGSAA